jgi:energy-coupling factor transport system ATP-binding protein
MLSGGQKQRAAIAGALAARSSCIVFDEPTSMLDPLGRRQVMDTIRNLNATEGLTILLITHSMSEAMLLRRVLVMDAGQIVLDGPPGQVFSQVTRLRDLRLDVPPIVEIAHWLRGWGMDLNNEPLILTVEQMVEALCGVTVPC